MISPYAKPNELEEFLPLLTLDEMEEYIEKINELLIKETDSFNKFRLMENRGILERAVKNYYT